ncbi:hypothetical protein ACX80E_13430 [Arthrobacter sp. TMN-49]
MATFRELHHGDAPLLLPNAWDVGSALAVTAAGPAKWQLTPPGSAKTL